MGASQEEKVVLAKAVKFENLHISIGEWEEELAFQVRENDFIYLSILEFKVEELISEAEKSLLHRAAESK